MEPRSLALCSADMGRAGGSENEMKFAWGSWRDPAIARDVKVLGVLGLLLLLAVAVPSGLVWVVLGPIFLGALAALIMLLRSSRSAPSHEFSAAVPHRGPNVSRISPAGLPGLVFAAGFIWMFWFGVPGFRPVVIGLVVVGCVAGFVLVVIERRHRVPTDTPLGLSGTASSPHGSDKALPPS